MTPMSDQQPAHDLVDFVALANQLTNEQKILKCLERIEVLLTPVISGGPGGLPSRDELAKIAAPAVSKFTGKRK
jgi:hypothetical protein